MINLFKIKGQKKEEAASAAGKAPVKKQSAGELRLHKGALIIDELSLLFFFSLFNSAFDYALQKSTCSVSNIMTRSSCFI